MKVRVDWGMFQNLAGCFKKQKFQGSKDLRLRDIFLNEQGGLRAGWKILLYAVLAALCTAAAISAYNAAARILSPEKASVAQTGVTAGMYLCLLAGALLPAILMLRAVDGRPVSFLGFAFHGRVWIELGQGALQSACMVTMIFLVEWIAGWAEVGWSGLQPILFLRLAGNYVVLLAIAAAFEETLLRGYAFQALVQGMGKVGAVCLASCIFGLAHLANPNISPFAVVNTMLAGVWLSSAYLKTRSLWLPTSLHMSWNLLQGLVYGFPLSGMPLSGSLFKTIQHGKEWLTGGSYGPEGGILSPLVLIVATIYITRAKKVRPSEKAAALWEGQGIASVIRGKQCK